VVVLGPPKLAVVVQVHVLLLEENKEAKAPLETQEAKAPLETIEAKAPLETQEAGFFERVRLVVGQCFYTAPAVVRAGHLLLNILTLKRPLK
jgi:hypothetical protein